MAANEPGCGMDSGINTPSPLSVGRVAMYVSGGVRQCGGSFVFNVLETLEIFFGFIISSVEIG